VSLVSMLGGIISFFLLVTAILFVVFGQVTVRKLRKNPETKHELGMELVSGWDILNTAQALSMPNSILRKFKNSRLSFLEANSELLYKHTTVFDRLLARIFFWLWMISSLSMIILVSLNATGLFD